MFANPPLTRLISGTYEQTFSGTFSGTFNDLQIGEGKFHKSSLFNLHDERLPGSDLVCPTIRL